MAFGDGLGRKQMTAHAAHAVAPYFRISTRKKIQLRYQTEDRYDKYDEVRPGTTGTTRYDWVRPGTTGTLRTWMVLVVDLPEACLQHVRVNLRRRQIRVAEHRLNGAEVGASLEKVRRKRVT